MSAADIPPVVSSILKKKSNVSRAIDTTRHTIETQDNGDGSTTISIVKRVKIPSTKALVPVPPQKMTTKKVYHPYREEQISDIKTVSQNKNFAAFSSNNTAKPSKKRQQKQRKYSFDDDMLILDAKYTEMADELEPPKRKEYRTVPPRDARSLKLTKNRKEEPVGIKAISDQKRKIKSQLVKKEPQFVNDGFRIEASAVKPSKKSRNNNINDRWLIDAAADELYGAGRAVIKAGKATGKIAGKAVRDGLDATKQGIREFNEISEIVCENPMLKNIAAQHEATMRGMKSQARHTKASIAATGNSKSSLSAGSLITQRGFVTRTNTQAVAPYPTQNQVIPKVIHRKGGDQVRYFLPTGQEVSAAVARKLLHGSVSVPTQANGASTTIEHTYSRDNKNQIVKKIAKTAPGLVRRNQSDGSVNKTRIATPSGLVYRHNSGVV